MKTLGFTEKGVLRFFAQELQKLKKRLKKTGEMLILSLRYERSARVKVVIVTVGCKLNQFESDALGERLRECGIEVVGDVEAADVVVINTCTVTNKADNKSRQHMKQAKRLGKRVVVTGCYATTDGEEIVRRGLADVVLSNEAKFTLPSLLQEDASGSDGGFPVVMEYERTRAYLKIQDGCDRFCSYCKIPFGRGRSRSLAFDEVLRRLRDVVARGYREVVLTGVNISDYQDGERGLSDLVGEMVEMRGEFRLRLSSLQPDQFDKRLIGFLSHPKMTPHFHLSLQSGSNAVLSRMRRHYTREEFMGLCESVRKNKSDTALTTDIIVGFPGETEEEFDETVDVVQRVGFSRVHLFSYSPRAGTWAAQQKQVDEAVKKHRLHYLEDVARHVAETWVASSILGKRVVVLVEEASGQKSYGYTQHYLYASLNGEVAVNTFVDCIPKAVWTHQGAVGVETNIVGVG